MTEVIVHPRVLGQGIGRAILEVVVPGLRARGRRSVETRQITEGSDGERWAQSLGFPTVHTVVMQALVGDPRDRQLGVGG